jgi:hypothetical protein
VQTSFEEEGCEDYRPLPKSCSLRLSLFKKENHFQFNSFIKQYFVAYVCQSGIAEKLFELCFGGMW